ncbi:MAG: hypothetical protein R2744_00280 [Bacteroidales bacterium]
MRNATVTLTTMYNVFGKRIYAVGTDDREDIYEKPVNTLDAIVSAKVR